MNIDKMDYWVKDSYPFTVIARKASQYSNEDYGLPGASFVGNSPIKPEIVSRQKLLSFFESNKNDYKGVKIFSYAYSQTIKQELDDLINAYPEAMI